MAAGARCRSNARWSRPLSVRRQPSSAGSLPENRFHRPSLGPSPVQQTMSATHWMQGWAGPVPAQGPARDRCEFVPRASIMTIETCAGCGAAGRLRGRRADRRGGRSGWLLQRVRPVSGHRRAPPSDRWRTGLLQLLPRRRLEPATRRPACQAEMRALGSIIMAVATAHQVPAGGALAWNREGGVFFFAQAVTARLEAHPRVTIEPRRGRRPAGRPLGTA